MEVAFTLSDKKMTISSRKLVLSDSETLDEVIECLIEHFPIETQGAFDQKSLFEILVKAASSIDSIENTAKIWFYRSPYGDLTLKCQDNKQRNLKFAKLRKPYPNLLISFNLLLIPSTVPLVVLCSK
jgi:hypothetical protein